MAVFMTGGKAPSLVNYVEYIETTGAQYFKTDFCPNQNTKVVAVVELLGSNNQAAFGARHGASNTCFFVQIQDTTKFRVDFGNASNQTAILSDTPHEKKTITQDKNVTTITPNGGTYTSANATFQCNYPLFIGAMNNAGSAACIATARHFAYQIYDNGTLVHDYRPCYDLEGVACFYDEVEKVYGYFTGGTVTAGGA